LSSERRTIADAGMALDAGQELWPPEEAVQGTSKSHGDSLLGGETWGGQKVKCLICDSFYQTGIKLSTIFVATHRRPLPPCHVAIFLLPARCSLSL
jgi:hypothetical protein